jgi:hypothetical protein
MFARLTLKGIVSAVKNVGNINVATPSVNLFEFGLKTCYCAVGILWGWVRMGWTGRVLQGL